MSLGGSEFVEMFVGVGASRVRDLRRSRGQVLAGLAGILASVLMAIWVGASFVAERVTLHPLHWRVGPTPAQLGHTYREVAFRDRAGLTLRGWWIPGTKHETVVMVHGWTSSRAEPMSKAGYLLDAGYNVLVFDLRGHGLSDGDYTTLGLTEPDDVATAVAFARSRDPGPIALLGYSMGGALAVETGARDADVAAVIEDSGYGSLDDVFRAGSSARRACPRCRSGSRWSRSGRSTCACSSARCGR
jgi:uncharacterized protein